VGAVWGGGHSFGLVVIKSVEELVWCRLIAGFVLLS